MNFGPLLAWTPFLDPIDLHAYWLWLLPPLILAIAVVYKALKSPSVEHLLADAARLAIYILVLILITAAALWGLVEVV